MRPRPFDRGNVALSSWKASTFNASMRPRPFDRGNGKSAEQNGARAETSMRPRPFDRGNAAPRAPPDLVHQGFNEATAIRPWKRAGLCWERFNDRSFNEATAIRPWKRRR